MVDYDWHLINGPLTVDQLLEKVSRPDPVAFELELIRRQQIEELTYNRQTKCYSLPGKMSTLYRARLVKGKLVVEEKQVCHTYRVEYASRYRWYLTLRQAVAPLREEARGKAVVEARCKWEKSFSDLKEEVNKDIDRIIAGNKKKVAHLQHQIDAANAEANYLIKATKNKLPLYQKGRKQALLDERKAVDRAFEILCRRYEDKDKND